MRLRVGQGVGDAEHAVAAAEVRHADFRQAAWQVRKEGAGANIQPFATEHVGMVDQVQARLLQLVTGGVGRGHCRLLFRRGDQQARLLHRQRRLHRTDVLRQQVAGGVGQVLDHAGGHHLGAGCQLTLQADQLLFQQRQGLGHADQHPVERPFGHFAGRYEAHARRFQAVARQVAHQAQVAQVGIATAGDRRVWCQAGGQGAEAVVQHQDARRGGDALLVQVVEQVLVGGVEGLQRVVLLFGLANQVELGERRSEYRHKNQRCF
ncbi:hypothetical protein D9M70_439250 [compost metagenome]